MRDILFRGKQIDNGEWVYGDLGQNQIDNNAVNWIENYNPETRIRRLIMVIHETVGQFTGLTDKNGVKIFEGDIVFLGGYGDYTVQYPFIELFEACFEGDIGSIKGNIHDNPELL